MDPPILVTAAIIEKDGKILLTKRAREPFKDLWCFIGGTGSFKKKEDPKEAVKDEVMSDIGCEFSPEFFTYNYHNFKVATVTLFFSGEIKGDIKPNPKLVSDYKWVDKKDVLKMDLGFAHKEILEKFISSR